MGMWLAVAWAWGAGVLLQLHERSLHEPGVYGLGLPLAALLLLAGARMRPAARRAAWLLAVALLAWASTGWRAHLRAPGQAAQAVQAALPGSWQMEVVVDDLPVWHATPAPGRWRFDARLIAAAPLAAEGPVLRAGGQLSAAASSALPWSRVRVWAPAQALPMPRPGEQWRFTARVDRPDFAYNPGAWDAARALFQQAVHLEARVAQQPAAVRVATVDGGVAAWRMHIRQDIMARVPAVSDAGVIAGLSVGDQSAIDRSDWEVFQRTGVAHLVSISGTHVLMMGWLGGWLVRRAWSCSFRLCRWCPAPVVGAWAAVLAALAYAMLAGWGVPAQRTVVMMALITGLRTLGVAWPGALIWSAAAAVVAVLDPWSLVQPSFWLSFVAVGTLMVMGQRPESRVPHPPAGRWRAMVSRARDVAGELVHTQARVSLVLTPVALLCFGSVSLLGFLVNLLAIPWFTLVITPLSLLGIVWAPVWDVAGWAVALSRDWLAVAADWRWASTPLPDGPFWLGALAVIMAPLLLLPLPGHLRWWLLPPAVMCLWLPPAWRDVSPPAWGHWQALVLDVGQGSAIVLQTARHTLVFDTGARWPSGTDAGQRMVLPALGALGIRRVDRLVISHDDIDHSGGAASVARRMAVDSLATSVPPSHALWQLRDARGVVPASHPCRQGEQWSWDGVLFVWLHPRDAGPTAEDDNARSCVLRVSAAQGTGAAMLLTGDIGAPQEEELVRTVPEALRAEVLIVPHHGSATSSSRAFLHAAQPDVAVVQVGRRNRYGHPDPQVMARLREAAKVVHVTPECGAYVHASDGRPGQCWRQRASPYWHPDRLHGRPSSRP
jgi:competence protein ComEC